MEKKHTLLVVDDDKEIGMMLKLMLEFNGFEVIVLERTENVIQTMIDKKVNLVILDLLIAGNKGTDVCKDIRSTPEISAIPVIMITALPNIEQECRDAGATGFVPKPFEMKDLVSEIKSQLS